MKKIFLYCFVMLSFITSAQTLSYSDQAVLFTENDGYGTARFMGLSGAFGALGGDMAAADINPAGLAVFNDSRLSTSLSYRDSKINTSFYGTTINNNDDYFKFSQIGGAIVFNNTSSPDLKKVSIGFNYSITKDFANNYLINGNSGVATFIDDPFLNSDEDDANNIYYTNVDDQYFTNYTSGINDKFVMSFATQYQDILYLGMSLNFHNINYYQNTYYEEYNNDGNGNNLDAFLSQRLTTFGNGFSFGFGAIIKPVQNLRLGLSYQSAQWYNLSESSIQYTDPDSGDTYPGDLEIYVSNNPDEYYSEYGVYNYFDYELKTPGKLTSSIAYVFGKKGLISLDYIYQDYTNINLKPSSLFINENTDLQNGLKGTSSVKIGTEWRLKSISFRGGYRFEESPYKYALSSEDLTGYSFGIGFKFNPMLSLDFSYDESSYASSYNFIDNVNVTPAQLDFTNKRFTSSLVLNF